MIKNAAPPAVLHFVRLYLKPLIKRKSVTLFDLDDSKSRPLILECWYEQDERAGECLTI